MSAPLRVLVVDDERLFAELMRVALGSAQDMQVVDVVHDVAGAVAATARLRPDVVLSDYHLPDGTGADVARSVRRAAPEASVLVLTGDPSSTVLADVARSGAVGHLTKSRGLDEVVAAVRVAATGEILFSPSELQRLLVAEPKDVVLDEPLTARELEVLRLLANGSSTSAASTLLGISTATLRAHVQAILRKLGAHSRLEAVAEAARLGLITLDMRARDRSPARGSALAEG
ncbi:MAG: response regulator transcription factor [Chloroflexi bacterium]|nr:MAG: response regulator transcription factor [Chloroflexota bacterium]TMB78770.1 MAG: response regulator transcription factor [Chloroflexota bacterium]TMC28887.1 MAG: response regulator transcription factor [Chloroflexota bacterium]TMC33830.1 MAG: response regulator transcription factor [Chloroflexota bacterium]TME43248.1 MAG: response regulator transcription factor [Chloroflexota bacterium]